MAARHYAVLAQYAFQRRAEALETLPGVNIACMGGDLDADDIEFLEAVTHQQELRLGAVALAPHVRCKPSPGYFNLGGGLSTGFRIASHRLRNETKDLAMFYALAARAPVALPVHANLMST